MKVIDRAEQIGLTWPGTTSRARSMIATTQTTTEPQLLRRIKKSTANVWLFFTHI